MPPRLFSVEGMMGLRSWRYSDGTAILRAVVAANSSIGDGGASALKPRRTRVSPYPAAATARANRISKTAFQGFMSASPVPRRASLDLAGGWYPATYARCIKASFRLEKTPGSALLPPPPPPQGGGA